MKVSVYLKVFQIVLSLQKVRSSHKVYCVDTKAGYSLISTIIASKIYQPFVLSVYALGRFLRWIWHLKDSCELQTVSTLYSCFARDTARSDATRVNILQWGNNTRQVSRSSQFCSVTNFLHFQTKYVLDGTRSKNNKPRRNTELIQEINLIFVKLTIKIYIKL